MEEDRQSEAQVAADSGTNSNIKFFDGVRGAAVAAVVLFHLMLYTGSSEDRSRYVIGDWITSYGYLGVSVFIVVSGFVLMYPMARRGTQTLPRGTWNFYKRRARRILPPYYAALGLSLLLILLVPALQQRTETAWDSKIPVTTGGITSHLLLIQDLSPSWANQINGPLWSVAVEFHLYLLMPVVLLPLWRRLGAVPVVISLFVLGVAMSLLDLASWAHPWLIALFAAGMMSSQVATGVVQIRHLASLTIMGLVGMCILFIIFHDRLTREVAISEMAFGLITAGLLAWFTKGFLSGNKNWVILFLETKPAVYLGIRSYSIYLVHSPILAVGNIFLLTAVKDPNLHLILMIFVVLPCSVIIGEVFYQTIERRFTTSHQRQVAS